MSEAAVKKRVKKKSKNNFKDPQVVAKVKYVLWICHNSLGCRKYPKTMTWKGFVTKPDAGLEGLKKLVVKKWSMIEQAAIYHAGTSNIVDGCKWDNRSK